MSQFSVYMRFCTSPAQVDTYCKQVEAALPDGTPLAIPGVVPRLSATPGGTRWLGPALGEHTDAVLGELGLDAARIAALRARGAI